MAGPERREPRPDRTETGQRGPDHRGIGRRWWVAGLAIAGLVVIVLAPLASPDPDGLESVAAEHGFLGSASGPLFDLLSGYRIPGLNGELSTVAAGLVGVALVVGLMVGLGRLLGRATVASTGDDGSRPAATGGRRTPAGDPPATQPDDRPSDRPGLDRPEDERTDG